MGHKRIILVTGATGKQGGTVCRHLLKNGKFNVRGMTRNPNSQKSKILQKMGVEMVYGDYDLPESVETALQNAYGVFSVQNFWEKGVGYQGEIEQGKKMADLSKKAGIKHFVQSTMADGQTIPPVGLAHFHSKYEIEKYIDTIQLPRTSIGTVTFMDNFMDKNFGGSWTFPFISNVMDSNTPYHMLALDDLGGIVTAIFGNPHQYLGKKINAASDFPTISEMKKQYREISGKHAKRISFPVWLAKMINREFVIQLQWQSKGNWKFTPADTSMAYPNLTSFPNFLQKNQIGNL